MAKSYIQTVWSRSAADVSKSRTGHQVFGDEVATLAHQAQRQEDRGDTAIAIATVTEIDLAMKRWRKHLNVGGGGTDAKPDTGPKDVGKDPIGLSNPAQPGSEPTAPVAEPDRDGIYICPTRSMAIPIQVNAAYAAKVKEVRLFASDNDGKTWSQVDAAPQGTKEFNYVAPHDGPFWLAIQTLETDGKVSPPSVDRLHTAMKFRVREPGRQPASRQQRQEEIAALLQRLREIEERLKAIENDRPK